MTDRYRCVGDCGTNYGWVVDWPLYLATPWWKRLFARHPAYIVAAGTREHCRAEARILNEEESVQ